MTDIVNQMRKARVYRSDAFAARLRRRHRSERLFRLLGIGAVGIAVSMLVVLLGSITLHGYTAFMQTELRLEVWFDPEVIDPTGKRDPDAIGDADYQALARAALLQQLPDATSRTDRRMAGDLMSKRAGFEMRKLVLANPALIGTRRTILLPASADADQFVKGNVAHGLAEGERRINDRQAVWLDRLRASDVAVKRFNWRLFANGDSREPELAGIWGGIVGSLLTLAVTLGLAVPIGVAAAVYLEEFAPHNRWTDLIEVNIKNLAAVPSIVFGLLGLAVFLNGFGMPRSAPLVGGTVLALMTLPVIIIAARAAMKAVPPSIREAALGIGASPLQVVTHHVLPLAAPGIMTGTIIGMARALGETAPLLMIGMVAFIVDTPRSFSDATTVLPVQIFMWATSPERGFAERTSAAILVLLAFLILMNAVAVYVRRRFERRW